MSKYLISFTRHGAKAMVEYNETGHMLKYELEPGAFEEVQFNFLSKKLPKHLDILEEWKKNKFENVTILEVEEDLSFERFYNAYDYKVSKRSVAEKAWGKMTATNKVGAIKHLPKYEAHLRKTGSAKKYPETYLNSEIWNN